MVTRPNQRPRPHGLLATCRFERSRPRLLRRSNIPPRSRPAAEQNVGTHCLRSPNDLDAELGCRSGAAHHIFEDVFDLPRLSCPLIRTRVFVVSKQRVGTCRDITTFDANVPAVVENPPDIGVAATYHILRTNRLTRWHAASKTAFPVRRTGRSELGRQRHSRIGSPVDTTPNRASQRKPVIRPGTTGCSRVRDKHDKRVPKPCGAVRPKGADDLCVLGAIRRAVEDRKLRMICLEAVFVGRRSALRGDGFARPLLEGLARLGRRAQ